MKECVCVWTMIGGRLARQKAHKNDDAEPSMVFF